MNNVWILVYDLWDEPWDFMVCLDEQTALEMYMSLVEEELYEEFYGICQDNFEDISQDWEERAQWIRLWDSLWCIVKEVPAHGSISC